ncbi:MAG: hypothetical protein Q8J76_11570, partial [Desulfobulbaceae bacterium]|nr:hypothetical protein [Desulfobulbaceae bacterium]
MDNRGKAMNMPLAGKSLHRLLLFLFFILLFPLVFPTDSRAVDAPTQDEIRAYVRKTCGVTSTSVPDTVLNFVLTQYPTWSPSPYLEVFGMLSQIDQAHSALSTGDYHQAISMAASFALDLAISDTAIGEVFSSVMGVADLAVLPIQIGLANFLDTSITTAWNNQTKLYVAARALGYSYQDIINRVNSDDLLFTDDGWLYIAGSIEVPSYGPVRPGNYTP